METPRKPEARKRAAYDYQRQTWVAGAEALPLLIAQTQQTLALLRGPKGAEFIAFNGGGITLARAVEIAEAKLAELESEVVP